MIPNPVLVAPEKEIEEYIDVIFDLQAEKMTEVQGALSGIPGRPWSPINALAHDGDINAWLADMLRHYDDMVNMCYAELNQRWLENSLTLSGASV
jgi:hypothetical protein